MEGGGEEEVVAGERAGREGEDWLRGLGKTCDDQRSMKHLGRKEEEDITTRD